MDTALDLLVKAAAGRFSDLPSNVRISKGLIHAALSCPTVDRDDFVRRLVAKSRRTERLRFLSEATGALILLGDHSRAADLLLRHPSVRDSVPVERALMDLTEDGERLFTLATIIAYDTPFRKVTAFGSTVEHLRGWIADILSDLTPTPAIRRRRLLLIHQAAEAPTEKVDPRSGGHVVDATDGDAMRWFAERVVRSGVLRRDARFAHTMRPVAADHAARTGSLDLLAMLGEAA